jgi:hypothetical protein
MAGEVRTPFYCLHPFFGYVCRPNTVLDFSDTVPEWFGHGAMAQIGPDGFRNIDRLEGKPPDEVWIGVLGGSVAFASASTANAMTISGWLERELRERPAPAARRRRKIRVWNLALPAGQQPQQTVILLMHARDLDGIITFDGVNEAIIGPYFNQGQIPDHFPFRPTYEVLYGGSMTAQQVALTFAIEDAETWARSSSPLSRFWVNRMARKRIADWRRRLRSAAEPGQPFASVFKAATHAGIEEWVEAGVRRWRDMIVMMHGIARTRGIDSSFVLQPVPEQNKPLTEHERVGLDAYPDMVALRKRAYPRLQEAARQLAAGGIDCLDYGGIFASVTDSIYTDHIHFEDRGCAIAARQLERHISGTWKCLA